MTRNNIVKWVEEAGIIPPGWGATENQWCSLERFAQLIVAAERQRKAWDATYWTAYEHDVAAAEREACAALCFQIWNKWMDEKDTTPFPDAEDCAAAIRARGQV